MKLIAFSVENYRSISSTPRLSLSNLTVLVGPNNEGKSNLLGALVCALSLAQELRPGLPSRSPYQFLRDCPVSLHAKEPPPKTKFLLEFDLDTADKAAFLAEVGSKLSGTLRIQLSIGQSHKADFTVKIQGPSQGRLSAMRREIAQFVGSRLQFQYIGAVRSEEQSREIVESMVSRALAALETNNDYQGALAMLERLERPILRGVSDTIQESLKPFLPGLAEVHTTINKEQRHRALRRLIEISLNDGSLTPLSQKGDGVKSLVAIALAKAAAESAAGSKNLILAIEEPEAHLHSGAIHSLKGLLEQVAVDRQVIISTHEPALVRRDSIGDNVIIEANQARVSKSLEELRQVLGVQLGENLVSPDLVVLVEGPNDEALLTAFAVAKFPQIQTAISSGRLRFSPLHGAGNLPHQLRYHRSMVSEAIAFLDDDQEGTNAFERAKADGLVSAGDVLLSNKPGAKEAELEDLIDPAVYEASLMTLLGVATLKPKGTIARRAKWSVRLSTALVECGKPKTDLDNLVSQAKAHVSQVARARADNCFIPALAGPVDNLSQLILKKLGICN